MNKVIQSSLIALLLGASVSAYAASATSNNSVDTATSTTIKQNLKSNLPDLVVDQILTTPFAGVYEVDSGRKVFYVNSTGNMALIGNMLDLTTKVSLTEQRTEALNKIDWTKLPLDIAVKRVIGTGQSNIAVFTDPDCPFCKRLEAETLGKLKDVTIYYYLFPLAIHPNAADDAKRLLCAENPESAIIAVMGKDKPYGKNNTCNRSKDLIKMQDVGNNLVQVTGTPTIVLPNGSITSGLLPADYLSRMIDQNQAESITAVVTNK